MRANPIIGVPSDRRLLDPHPFHMVGEKYLQGLIDGADALPLIVPVLPDELDIDTILAPLDGVLLTGSPSDLEPHHYGEEVESPESTRDPHRDLLNLALATRALEIGMPLLAVCRGHQELNVALGGSLHQRLKDVPGMQQHKENPGDPLDVQYGPSHDLSVVEGSYLHDLIGESRIVVNSLHGQGIKRLADGVTVQAVADDGLVEAFKVDVDSFALSVQWHPEWHAKENPISMAIFKAFGDACRSYASERQV